MAKYAMLAMTEKITLTLTLSRQGRGKKKKSRGRGENMESFPSRISFPSCLSAFIRHPHHPSFPKSVVGDPKILNTVDP